MRASTRKKIRRATRSGVSVREGLAEDIQTFCDLLWALCARRGTTPTPPQPDFFNHLWHVFHSSGQLKLLFSQFNGEVVSGILLIPFGSVVRCWKIGWAGRHSDKNPNELLYWEAVRWAKLNGYHYFDFVSIKKDFAIKLQNSEAIDWSDVWGPDDFKVGFGGFPIILPEPYYRSYHPFVQTLLRAGGHHLLESHHAAKLLHRLAAAPE